jgi:hypothetical protein
MSNGYKVKVTSEDGLKTTVYRVFDEYVGITIDEARNIKLYPNPTKNILYIDGLVQGDKLRVYNMLGVMVDILPFEQFNGFISLESLNPGLYFIEISSRESAPLIFKVYKQRF